MHHANKLVLKWDPILLCYKKHHLASYRAYQSLKLGSSQPRLVVTRISIIICKFNFLCHSSALLLKTRDWSDLALISETMWFIQHKPFFCSFPLATRLYSQPERKVTIICVGGQDLKHTKTELGIFISVCELYCSTFLQIFLPKVILVSRSLNDNKYMLGSFNT